MLEWLQSSFEYLSHPATCRVLPALLGTLLFTLLGLELPAGVAWVLSALLLVLGVRLGLLLSFLLFVLGVGLGRVLSALDLLLALSSFML